MVPVELAGLSGHKDAGPRGREPATIEARELPTWSMGRRVRRTGSRLRRIDERWTADRTDRHRWAFRGPWHTEADGLVRRAGSGGHGRDDEGTGVEPAPAQRDRSRRRGDRRWSAA